MADGLTESGDRGLTDERLRLLEGLSYRAAMALQKALLARYREQSVHVADALLEFARAPPEPAATTSRSGSYAWQRSVLDAREASLWLQPDLGAELAPMSSGTKTPSIAGSCSRRVSRPRSPSRSRSGLKPTCSNSEQYREIPARPSSAAEGTPRWRLHAR